MKFNKYQKQLGFTARFKMTAFIVKIYTHLSHKLQCCTRIFRLEESQNNIREKMRFFLIVCSISPISCWHVTCLSRYSVMLMNGKAFINLNPSFLGLLMLKHWKIRITHKQFSLRGGKPKYKRKNRRLRTLAAENKKRQLEDLPQANFGRAPEKIFSFS